MLETEEVVSRGVASGHAGSFTDLLSLHLNCSLVLCEVDVT